VLQRFKSLPIQPLHVSKHSLLLLLNLCQPSLLNLHSALLFLASLCGNRH
jgi:hypothetical protein